MERGSICVCKKEADGGVILIDEAGCLTVLDEFTEEAVTELVRHLYHENLGGGEFAVMKSSYCRKLMNGAAPKEIRAKTDPFNRMLLLKNRFAVCKKMELRKAEYKGIMVTAL